MRLSWPTVRPVRRSLYWDQLPGDPDQPGCCRSTSGIYQATGSLSDSKSDARHTAAGHRDRYPAVTKTIWQSAVRYLVAGTLTGCGHERSRPIKQLSPQRSRSSKHSTRCENPKSPFPRGPLLPNQSRPNQSAPSHYRCNSALSSRLYGKVGFYWTSEPQNWKTWPTTRKRTNCASYLIKYVSNPGN